MLSPLAVIFALPEEVRPLLKASKILKKEKIGSTLLMEAEFSGKRVVFCQTGTGMNRAHEGIERAIERFHPSMILSVGYAGASDATLKTGDLVIPSEIRSETPTDHFKTDGRLRESLEKAARDEGMNFRSGLLVTLWKIAGQKQKKHWREKGMEAVDMETAALIAVAMKSRVPFISLRAVFDTLEQELPFGETPADETKPISFLFKHPMAIFQVPRLFRMNRLCQKNLARVVGRFISSVSSHP
jgi:adenosylhomocysteine nucleosidase